MLSFVEFCIHQATSVKNTTDFLFTSVKDDKRYHGMVWFAEGLHICLLPLPVILDIIIYHRYFYTNLECNSKLTWYKQLY